MTTPTPPVKQGKARSPAYPAVPLPTAIDSARKLWTAQRKQEAHIDSALKALGYTARSGTALRALSALGQYGLIDESGSKDARKIRLSESAQDILLLNDADPRKGEAIKRAALLPTIYAALWERYGAQPPDDDAIRPYLTRDKNYNESVVDRVLANYRGTLEFAKLDKIGDDTAHDDSTDTSTKARIPSDLQRGSRSMTLDQELPILVGNNRVARIPFPMTADDFDLLIGTLNLWKKKLLAPKADAENEASPPQETDQLRSGNAASR
jgi:hypothetical protein